MYEHWKTEDIKRSIKDWKKALNEFKDNANIEHEGSYNMIQELRNELKRRGEWNNGMGE